MNLKTVLPAIVGAVAGGLVALAVSSGNNNNSTSNGRHVVTHTTTVQSSASSGTALPTAFASTGGKGYSINQIYRMDSPGIVDIDVISTSNQGLLGAQQQEDEGAGVVYDSSGDIVTDEHVVAGAQKITVHFQDGQSAGASLVGDDPSTDTAVIHVSVPASELHPIKFANSNTAEVGDPVVAIGSPFSYPETTTQGIVSQVGRSIEAPNNYTITGAIQTDAAINPGNSGGPLLDAQGQVLGLSDQIDTQNQTNTGEGSSSGVGFAVPSNTVVQEATGFISGHPVKHSYLGVCLNATSANGAQIAPQGGTGCTYSVQPNSPAANAGLQPGDTITAIDGRAITSTEQFIQTVATYQPGQKITLTVHRAGQTKQIVVTLGLRPANSPTSSSGTP